MASDESDEEFELVMMAIAMEKRKRNREAWVGELCMKRRNFGAFYHLLEDLGETEFRFVCDIFS